MLGISHGCELLDLLLSHGTPLFDAVPIKSEEHFVGAFLWDEFIGKLRSATDDSS